jgi:hypothetical protein
MATTNRGSSDIFQAMKESSTYQAILEEGRIEGRVEGAIEEARKILLMFGIPKLGCLSASTLIELANIDALDRLEAFIYRLDTVKNWPDLLATTPPKRSR